MASSFDSVVSQGIGEEGEMGNSQFGRAAIQHLSSLSHMGSFWFPKNNYNRDVKDHHSKSNNSEKV